MQKVRKIHFVGIKGVAMTALASFAKQAGYVVTGSDTDEIFPTQKQLELLRIKIFNNFSAVNISLTKPDLVIYTGAHGGRGNAEVVEAVRQSITVISHGEALGKFMSGKRQISVAGSHGKTTTAAMIAAILTHAGLDPSYAIGCGEIFGLGSPGHYGGGEWFVAEADEYMTDPGHDPTPRFLWQKPEILVVTNIDFDHPDAFRSLEDVKESFKKFRDILPPGGSLVLSSDDPNSRPLVFMDSSVTLVGEENADCEIKNIHFSPGRTFFSLEWPDEWIGEFVLQVPGRHNAVNAAMAIVASFNAGVARRHIYESLNAFKGTKRRFERIAQKKSVIFYDDYAHHPKEIAATISATRQWYPNKRIITVFQPHTFSRTRALLEDFAKALSLSDIACVTDIYGSARELNHGDVAGNDIVKKITSLGGKSSFAAGRQEVIRFLSDMLKPDDIVLFMGAGDIFNWEKDAVNAL